MHVQIPRSTREREKQHVVWPGGDREERVMQVWRSSSLEKKILSKVLNSGCPREVMSMPDDSDEV